MRDRRRGLKQDATYWAPALPDGFGSVGFSAPIKIKCRWEAKSELFRDKDAREVMSSAIVYVDRTVALQGFLALGTFTQLDPRSIGREIRQRGVSPNLRATHQLNKVYL